MQLVGQHLPADGIEHQVPEPHVLPALRQLEAPGRSARGGVVLGPVGIGVLAPVGQHPHEGVEAQPLGLAHQQLLVPGQGLLGGRGAGPGQGAHLGLTQRPGQPGRLGLGQVAKGAPEVHPPASGGGGKAAAPGQPGRARAGPAGLPGPAGVKGRGGSGGGRFQAGQAAVQHLDGLPVGQGLGIGVAQPADHRLQLVQHHPCIVQVYCVMGNPLRQDHWRVIHRHPTSS